MIRFILIATCLITIQACSNDPTMGYSSNSLYSPAYRSVALPIFKNETMMRELEFQLTDALIKEIESKTPYRILGEQYADTLLTGTIKNVELQTISQSTTTGLDGEVLINVTVDFEWLDLKSGQRIGGRRNFSCSALFTPSQPSSEPIEMGRFAVVQKLSSDIVEEMQSSW